MKKTLGIIGFGRFGQLVAKGLKRDFCIYVWNRSDKKRIADKLKVDCVSLDKAASADIVIFCVAISALKEMLMKAKPYIRSGSLVMDVCSVKEYPINLMKRILPKDVEILGTHPLFGPDSIREKKNRKVVICPVRTKRLSVVRRYLRKRGFGVIITTPAKHDAAARCLSLVHLIGRASVGLKEQEIDTLAYNLLLRIKGIAENDSWQLFRDVNKYNRFAKKTNEDFIKKMINLCKKVGK